ncbi:hypothetical protein H9L39_06333 [Fusarium oxysporum f. sp. albedinis]|nr:hypothetical protein H9L39_06333 [Fusarium oxysporum f. sp. albedinis]
MKFGRNVRPIEANNMLYVAKHTTIPVPRVYAIYQRKENKKTITYILMEYIPGKSLVDLCGLPNINLFMQDDITGPLKSEREFVDVIIRSYAIELGPRGAHKVRTLVKLWMSILMNIYGLQLCIGKCGVEEQVQDAGRGAASNY